jgi:hypothetical protein
MEVTLPGEGPGRPRSALAFRAPSGTMENMSPRRPTPPPPKPPDFSPEKTCRALQKQLAALDKLRGRKYHEVENEEEEWRNLTLNILNHGFGEGSENVSQFHHAKWAGEHYMGGMSPGLIQQNFEKRIESFAAMLRSALAELELMMPEPELAGSYEPGDEYQFYRDLKTIVGFATSDLFIIDNYLDTQIFDVYMENVAPPVAVRVLTSQVSVSLRAVAEKYSKRGNLELRSSKDAHDRVVFSNDRCWVIGQSIKDAARKKPTYIVEHSGAATMKSIYEGIWPSATVIVKS